MYVCIFQIEKIDFFLKFQYTELKKDIHEINKSDTIWIRARCKKIAQSAATVEYTDCFSAEG